MLERSDTLLDNCGISYKTTSRLGTHYLGKLTSFTILPVIYQYLFVTMATRRMSSFNFISPIFDLAVRGKIRNNAKCMNFQLFFIIPYLNEIQE